MKKENFDEILKDALEEYVKDTESEPTEKIKFSKRHERNMEAIFKSIENGTLGNFEVEETTEKDDAKVDSKIISTNKIRFCRIAKVAIFVLLAVFSLAIAPGLEAWRTDELNLYGENKDEYAWILPNDVTERLEIVNNSGEEYLEIFGYLPEGAEIENVVDSASSLYVKVDIYDSNFQLRIFGYNNKPSIDTENLEKTKLKINSIDVDYYCNNNTNIYIWMKNERMYRLYGKIEHQDMIEIIGNLNYERIEKFF